MILDNHTESCPGDDCEREGCEFLPENQDCTCRPLGGQHSVACALHQPIIATHPPKGMSRHDWLFS
jgi:hypothetical protein